MIKCYVVIYMIMSQYDDFEDTEEIDETMAKKIAWEKIRYRGGKPDIIYCKIKIKDLTKLFNVSRMTIYRWIKQNKLNPVSLESICERYCFYRKGHANEMLYM